MQNWSKCSEAFFPSNSRGQTNEHPGYRKKYCVQRCTTIAPGLLITDEFEDCHQRLTGDEVELGA